MVVGVGIVNQIFWDIIDFFMIFICMVIPSSRADPASLRVNIAGCMWALKPVLGILWMSAPG